MISKDNPWKRRTLEEAKAARRARWAEMEAKRPPLEVSLYGLGSMLSGVVFLVWVMAFPSVFANVALASSIVVWAATVAFQWRWDEIVGR
jgi:hypothetical protein